MPLTPEERRERRQQYRIEHRQELRQAAARYRAENPEKRARYRAENIEKRRAYNRRYTAEHREERRAYRIKYYAEHPEKLEELKATKFRYYMNNRDRHRVHVSTRRARKRNAPITDFTGQQWCELKEAYKHRCAYCGKKSKRLEQEHITPLARGGSHTLSNIVPSCRNCNAQKQVGSLLLPVQPMLLTLAPAKPKIRAIVKV